MSIYPTSHFSPIEGELAMPSLKDLETKYVQFEEFYLVMDEKRTSTKPYARSTVYKWLLEGRVKGALQLGQQWFIPKERLQDFVPPKAGRPVIMTSRRKKKGE